MKQNKKELEKINKLKENGLNLRRYKNQTYEMCLAAVQQDGFALQYVKEQTPEICLEAVKNDWQALRFVKNKTPQIVQAALTQTEYANSTI